MSNCFFTKATDNFKPVKMYKNFKNDRQDLIKEQKDKAGVYLLLNLINAEIYIGSSINISSRMRNYLNKSFLNSKKNINLPITKALLKYGLENFAV
jgi:hypothetical protein